MASPLPSSNALGRTELQEAIAVFLGYSRTTTDWSTKQTNNIDDALQEGVRRFYLERDWTFLRPTTTLTLLQAASGALVSTPFIAKSRWYFTATESVFVSGHVGKTLHFEDADYLINSYISGTQVACTAITESVPTALFSGTLAATERQGGTSTITLDDARLLADGSMVGFDLVFLGSGTSYPIIDITSTTVCEVDGDASGEATDDDIEIRSPTFTGHVGLDAGYYCLATSGEPFLFLEDQADAYVGAADLRSPDSNDYSIVAPWVSSTRATVNQAAQGDDGTNEVGWYVFFTTTIDGDASYVAATNKLYMTHAKDTPAMFDADNVGEFIYFSSADDVFEIDAVLGDFTVQVSEDVSGLTALDTWELTTRAGTLTVGAYSSPMTPMTGASGTFSSDMLGHLIRFNASGNTFMVGLFSSSTSISVFGDASGEANGTFVTLAAERTAAKGDTFTVLNTGGDIDLPLDYGDIEGDLHLGPGEGYRRIPVVSQGQILNERQLSDLEGYPQYAAIRPKVSDGSGPQLHELMVYPSPDASYTVYMKYRAIPRQLDANYPYPLGGAQHAATIRAACLAAADDMFNDKLANKEAIYQRLLANSTKLDERAAPNTLGYNSDPSIGEKVPIMHGSGTGRVLYNGE